MFGQQQEQTGPSVNLKITVTLEELYTGNDYELQYNRNIICPHCRGSGADDPDHVATCPECRGAGTIIKRQQIGPGMVQQFQSQCDRCTGSGKIKTSTCHLCKGEALTDSMDSLMIWVEKGTPDNHVITYKDAADEFINVRAGSINIKVIQLDHDVFERKGNDLKTRIHISLKEALVGFERELKHLDGHIVNIDRRDKVTKPGLMERFKDEGMPVFEQYSETGDLLVTYIVEMPDKLSEEQKVLFKEFFAAA